MSGRWTGHGGSVIVIVVCANRAVWSRRAHQFMRVCYFLSARLFPLNEGIEQRAARTDV